MNDLPPQMTTEEEKYINLRLLNGDGAARTVLMERNMRLVLRIAKKFGPEEDFISFGTIGLIKAANAFDPSRKVKFATFAGRCIENEILMSLRKRKRNEVSFEEVISTDVEGNSLTLDMIIGTQGSLLETLEYAEEQILIRKAFDLLPPRLKEILVLRYYYYPKLTHREIATRLSISRSYVSNLEKRAVKELKKLFLRLSGNGSMEKLRTPKLITGNVSKILVEIPKSAYTAKKPGIHAKKAENKRQVIPKTLKFRLPGDTFFGSRSYLIELCADPEKRHERFCIIGINIRYNAIVFWTHADAENMTFLYAIQIVDENGQPILTSKSKKRTYEIRQYSMKKLESKEAELDELKRQVSKYTGRPVE